MRASSSRNYWTPVIICPHPAMVRVATAELGVDTISWLEEYPQPAAVAGLAAIRQANLCFLDVAMHQEQALSLISETAPLMPVVALHPRKDADLILRGLRRGAANSYLSRAAGNWMLCSTAWAVCECPPARKRPPRSTAWCQISGAAAQAPSPCTWPWNSSTLVLAVVAVMPQLTG